MVAIPFTGASYESISPNFSSQTTINLYPTLPKPSDLTKYQGALFGTPGKSLYLDLTGHSVRRIYATTNKLYAVVDSFLYQVNADLTFSFLGSLATNTGLCQITSNFTQIAIVDGTNNLYVWDIPSTTFSANAIPNNDTASAITQQDSYGIFPLDNSISFQITAAGDFRSMDILQRGAISSASLQNKLTAVASHSLELWIMGTTRIEIWRNNGTVPFTYGRAEGIFIEVGCVAKDSVQVMDNSIIWLSNDEKGQAIVYRGNGYTPVIISTDPLHRIFAAYTTISDAKSFSYSEDGHLFYILTFPSANATWVYDCTTQLWHRRTSWDPTYYQTTRDITNGLAFFNGKHIIGDYASGKLYMASTSIYAEGDHPIYRERTLPTLDNGLHYITCRNLQIDVESGVVLSTGQGSDPQINLQAQKDGIWGNIVPRSSGKTGEFNKRVRWNRNDIARRWIFRFTQTDPVPALWLAVIGEFEPGTQ